MTPAFVRRVVALSVGQRLFLGLLPSLLAVALVIGLAYWGEYGRTAPELVVVGAAVLAVASLAVTWRNTRYLAARIARLAGTGEGTLSPRAAHGMTGGADELDRIEQVVDQLWSALTVAESERARVDEAASERLHEHATMLSATVRSVLAQLDEVRLPLHILLEARFGELNENQEELLGTARDATDAMDAALHRLARVADADRGAFPVQRELVQVNDVVRAVLPLAHAAAQRRGARVEVALEPGLSRVLADRVRLAEALALLTEAAAAWVGPERPLVVSTARDQRRVAVAIAPAPRAGPAGDTHSRGAETRDDHAVANPPPDWTREHDVVLASRLVEAQGGSVERSPTGMRIHLG
jgi:signal transduction histidine kinase